MKPRPSRKDVEKARKKALQCPRQISEFQPWPRDKKCFFVTIERSSLRGILVCSWGSYWGGVVGFSLDDAWTHSKYSGKNRSKAEASLIEALRILAELWDMGFRPDTTPSYRFRKIL